MNFAGPTTYHNESPSSVQSKATGDDSNAPLGTLQPADASSDAATVAQPTTGRNSV